MTSEQKIKSQGAAQIHPKIYKGLFYALLQFKPARIYSCMFSMRVFGYLWFHSMQINKSINF